MSAAHFELPPLSGFKLVATTFALSLATFMNVLDMTIANVSIPAIAGDLGVSPNQGTWVITSFAVATAISVPLTGWLSQRFGTVHLFVVCLILFVLASLACGLSTNLQMLIFFRIFQGAAAGPMIPLSQALLLQSFPREKSAMALAAWSMTTLVAPVLGPVMGGWISDNLSWPWIFYINVPTGIVAIILTWQLLHQRETPIVKRPVDAIGLALLVISVGALQIMLDKGKELDWFNAFEIRVLAAVTIIGFAFFLVWELTDEHPVVDLSLFQSRNFSAGVIALALGYGIFMGAVVMMPLWMQQFLGYTASWAGLLTAPGGLIALLLMPLVGKLLPKSDPRLFASVSFLIFALVAYIRAGFTLEVTPWVLVLPQLIQGAAVATFFVPLTSLTISGLHPARIAAAAGLSNFIRMMAAAVGISMLTTLWDDRASMHHAHLIERVSPYDAPAREVFMGLANQGMSSDQIAALIDRQATAQAYMLSANDYYYLTAIILVVLALGVWLAKPKAHRPIPNPFPPGEGAMKSMD